MPWSWGSYELRYEYFNKELDGFHPLWINADFLSQGKVVDNKLHVNGLTFNALYVDVQHLDIETLEAMLTLAEQGLPVCLKRRPLQAGFLKDDQFDQLVDQLISLPNVDEYSGRLITHRPLLEGENLPEFWCRTDEDEAVIFFANPLSGNLKYPLAYGQSYQDSAIMQQVTINFNGKSSQVELRFEPYQSLLLKVNKSGETEFVDITFVPKTPTQKTR